MNPPPTCVNGPETFHVFSDYSKTEEEASFACAVFKKNSQGHYEFYTSHSAKLDQIYPTLIGEIIGSLAGVQLVPNGANVLCFIDVAGINNIIATARKKTVTKIQQQKEEIKLHRQRLNCLHFYYVSRKKRLPIYRWCHKQARSLIRCIKNDAPVQLHSLSQLEIQKYLKR